LVENTPWKGHWEVEVFQGSECFGPAFATKNEGFHFSVVARDSGQGPEGPKGGRKAMEMEKILGRHGPMGLRLGGQGKSGMKRKG
jgi:hypothetical protein